MKASLPNNEKERLEALYQYNILGTAPEEVFDDFTELAAQICETPIALITFIDNHRQWFKSKVGLTITQTAREVSFCTHTIRGNEVFLVKDALADERFTTNKLVTSEPHIRFYAGAPLITSTGYALGTICVIDYVPRELNSQQLRALQSLSRQVMTQLELRRTLVDLEQTKQQSEQLEKKLRSQEQELLHFRGKNSTIGLPGVDENGIILWPKQAEQERNALWAVWQRFFQLSLDLLCIAELDGHFKHLNPAWETLLGYTHAELQSQPSLDFVHPQDQAATLAEVKRLTTGSPTIDFENRYRCKDGSYKWLAWKAFPSVEEGLVYAIARDITELKRTQQEHLHLLQREQEAWAESEAARNQITQILESITDAFFALDREWRFTYLNQQSERLLHRKREELLGQCLWDKFPEAVGSTFYQEYHRAVTQGVSVEFEAFYSPLNTWFCVHAYPSEQGLSVYFENINERKQFEAELIETTTLQHAILNCANYTIISTTTDGTIRTFNAAAERLLGYTPEEVVGKETPLLIHDPEEVVQRAQELTTELGIPIEPGFETFMAKARLGEPDEREWTYIRKDGSHLRVLLSVTALRDSEGYITGFLSIGSDITERKRVEAALNESEQRWQLALRGNHDGIWDWNLKTNDVFFSARWKEMLGYEDHEIAHHLQEWEKLVHPDDIDWVYQAIQNHLTGRTPFYITEHRERCKDGTYKWILDRGEALWDEQGNVVRMIGSHTDITERKQAEELLKTRTQQQAVVIALGQRALAGTNLLALMDEATQLVAQSLDVEYCKVLELMGDGNALLLRSGVGWQQGLVGQATVSTQADSQAGYTLITNEPVIVSDLRTETRFSDTPLLHEHGVVSGVSVIIPGSNRPFGVLGAHTSIKRTFTQENVHFLQSVANVLATAMERQRAEEELRRQNRRSQLFAEITLKIRQSLQLEEILQTTVTEVHKILDCDRVLIYRVWPNGMGRTVTEAVKPGWPVILDMPFPEEVFPLEYQELYRQGKIGAIADVEQAYAEVTPCLLEFLKPWAVKAKLVVPILLSGQLWGLLIAHHCTSPRQWTAFEIEILQQLSEQIGLALGQSQLLERETRQRLELSRSNAELQEFAYVASHDLQEPLRKIQAFGDRLKAKYGEALTDQGRDYLERMQNAAGRMQALIDDLLTLSRVTTRAQPFVFTNLTQVVGEVLSDLEVRIQQTGGRIEVGELPTLDADPIQMRQLLQNLIGNALKFHRDEEPPVIKIYSQSLSDHKQQLRQETAQRGHPEDDTGTHEYGKTVEEGTQTRGHGDAGNCLENLSASPCLPLSSSSCQIFIEDNGIGFEEKYNSRIFHAFQRLHGRGEYEGTGMGLAICRKIAERHNGSITAKSQPGQGSTFIVTLPLPPRQGETAK